MPDAVPREARLAMSVLWVVPLFWAVNYIVARAAPGVIGPATLALGRWLVAALALLCFCGPELWQRRREVLAQGWQYLVLGVLGMLVCGAGVYEGARSTSAMNMALIYAASPVLIALGAALWLGERFSWPQALGVVLALAGVVNVVVRGQWTALASVQFVAGDGWIVAATIAWAAYALLLKKWPSALGVTARFAAICLAGVLVLLPFALWESVQPAAAPWSLRAFWLVMVAGLIPGLGAYGIYGWAQKMLGASRVAVALYLGPLYTAAVAWAMLGEFPGWHHAVGALLILPGVFLVSRKVAARPDARLPDVEKG
ncbi:MAG: family transporter [Polaromonas sp.]|nr:family transporter [Polaromonas sp.]